MLSTSNSSSIDIKSMTPSERFAFEQRLEDEYVTGELSWTSKKKDIIKTWADLLSFYVTPENTICAYIKNRLRLRGVSEGSIAYVHECLTGEYERFKDPVKDTSDYVRGNPRRPEIFEDFDDIAKQTLTPEELRQRSKAEKYEIITREIRFIKGMKTKWSDRLDILETIAKEDNIKIPEFEKVSAEIPPEHFHGQSEMYYSAEGFEQEYKKMARSWEDIKKMIYYFRPSPEVARRSAELYEQFKASELANLQSGNMILTKAYQNILIPISDAKWGTILSGWFKIGRDQQVNYGSNGAGVKNAIPTGYIVAKEYRDGRKELIAIDRGYTKEQVSDRMERDLIKLALIQTTANKIEKAHINWINNTNIVEMIKK